MSEIDYTLPPWGALGRNAVLGIVSGGSKLILQGLNRFHVNGLEKLEKAVMRREKGRPLFTVSNHTSTLDDPVLFSALLPWSFFWTESQHLGNRWSLCAREMCYKSLVFSHIFQNGKVLPIERGQGIDQPIMRIAAKKASEGDWVHVFPEARVGYTGSIGPLKWGIGKLVCEAYREDQSDTRQPLVLPFYHSGMGRVLPKGSVVPRAGHDVHVEIGDPVDLTDVLHRCNCKGQDLEKAWTEITDRIAVALTELEQRSPANWNQKQGKSADKRSSPPPVHESPS